MTKKQKQKTNTTTQLAKVYYDPAEPVGYAGAKRLQQKFPRTRVMDWLKTQPAYSLHKPMRRRFPTRKYQTSGLNELWQMDLMEMIPYSSVNKGYKYILTVIDVFSRFARAEPLKSKNSAALVLSLTKLFKQDTPRYVQTDLGREFYNKQVAALFKEHGIKHYSVNSQFKAAVVERFNRTLRERFNRYFTHRGNKVWIDALPKIIDAYNHSSHRGIKDKRPIDIANHMSVWLDQQQQQLPQTSKPVIKVGELVRISRISTSSPFRKNFDQNWSEEIFRVLAIDKRDSPIMYVLQDLKDQVIQGKFYREELQPIGNVLPQIYRIEKILQSRGTGKHKQYLVKWYGYDNSHNSWISANQFVEQL